MKNNVITLYPGDVTPEEIINGTRNLPEDNENINEENKTTNESSKDENEVINEKNVEQLLKTLQNLVGTLESQWNASKKEYNLNNVIMKKLFDYNDSHSPDIKELAKMFIQEKKNSSDKKVDYEDLLIKMFDNDTEDPNKLIIDTLTPDGFTSYAEDHKFDGLDKITPEEVVEIFGEDHNIIAVHPMTHEITIERIKSICNDFYSWMSSVSEYRKVHDAYMELLEEKENDQIDELKKAIEDEEDLEKKNKMQNAIDNYYNKKYLDFLAEPLSDKEIDRLIAAFTNERKIQYLIDRGIERLKQLEISSKFILEISQFEKRFLAEKYHPQNNMLLLYFLERLIYDIDVYNKKNDNRTKIVCIVYGLDKIIRKSCNEEVYDRIMQNIVKFEDQFVGRVGNSSTNLTDNVLIDELKK